MNTAEYLLRRGADESIAIVDATGSHTYRELRALVAHQVNALAGLRNEARPVAIVAPNGVGWAAAYLAILAAGMVAVPVPNTLTPDETVARLDWVGAGGAFVGHVKPGRSAADAWEPHCCPWTPRGLRTIRMSCRSRTHRPAPTRCTHSPPELPANLVQCGTLTGICGPTRTRFWSICA